MHSKSDNIEVIINEADADSFDTLKKIVIKIIWNQSKVAILSSIIVFNYEFVFDVQLLYYKCHKINRNHEGSYVDSPDWIKNKKATKSSKDQ